MGQINKKQKILICGATGFIGRNITEHYAKNSNFDVHAVCFSRKPYNIDNITWHKVDLRNPDLLDNLLQDVDILIQAAATTSGSKDITSRPYIHVTDNAVMNSYLFRKAYEKNINHVIFFSCTVMYQSSESSLTEQDFDQNKPLHPKYFGVGNTKVYLEKMCEFYGNLGKTKFTAIRHSNIYGPHDKFDLEKSHVFGATITKVMSSRNSKVSVWGTGEEKRDLLYIDDLINFVDLAIKNQKHGYRLYNCGLGIATSIKELVNKIVLASGKGLKIEHDLSKPTIPTSLYLNCELAKKELGWEPKVTLEEGIKKTIAWWKQNIESKVIENEFL